VSDPTFHACFSTLGCPNLGLAEVFALARARRVASVELRALNGTIDLIAEFKRVFGSSGGIKAWSADQPVRVAMIGTSFRLRGSSAEDREALLAFVEWAEALGASWLRVFDGCEAGAAGEIAEAAATLAWWTSERQRRGFAVDLATETHDATAQPAALKAFLAAAPGCRILWDAHHTWRRGGEAPQETWAYLRPHVIHVHFKDSVTAPGVGEGYAYVPPGDGEFPLGELIDGLTADRYAGALCLEWERLWHPLLPPIEAALDRLDRFPWWNRAGMQTA
jgi:sugar phosphate isomerase/epimerase